MSERHGIITQPPTAEAVNELIQERIGDGSLIIEVECLEEATEVPRKAAAAYMLSCLIDRALFEGTTSSRINGETTNDAHEGTIPAASFVQIDARGGDTPATYSIVINA